MGKILNLPHSFPILQEWEIWDSRSDIQPSSLQVYQLGHHTSNITLDLLIQYFTKQNEN